MLIVDGVCLYESRHLSFQVFKNLKLFMENKQPGDELFDRLNVSTLIPKMTAIVCACINFFIIIIM